jgi:hypothetical protein
VLFFSVHRVVRWLSRVIVGSAAVAKLEVENAVLRHQLRVLRRTVKRPPFRRRDRLLLAAASGLVPLDRWTVFLVSPQTLLRWHRELVRRKWSYRHRSPGRPHLDPVVQELVLRLAREKPAVGLCADPGRVAQARYPGGRDHDQVSVEALGSWSGAASWRPVVGGVSRLGQTLPGPQSASVARRASDVPRAKCDGERPTHVTARRRLRPARR